MGRFAPRRARSTGSRGRDLSPFVLADGCSAAECDEVYLQLCGLFRGTIEWYLKRKARASRAAKAIRLSVIALGLAGAAVPLVATLTSVSVNLGYLALVVAAGLQLVDRFFGFSSGWSRSVSVAMQLNGFLLQLELEYLSLSVDAPDADHWVVLREGSARLMDSISSETTAWESEFVAAVAATDVHSR